MTYTIRIVPSDEDEGFIAVVPELAGGSAFGETEGEAFGEAAVAVDLWLKAAQQEGREIPGARAAGSTGVGFLRGRASRASRWRDRFLIRHDFRGGEASPPQTMRHL